MTATLPFGLWEAALLLAAVRIVQILSEKCGQKISAELFFALVLSSDMVLEATSASALSFAHANSIPAYLSIAAALLLFGARPAVVNELWRRWRQLEIWQFRFTAAFLAAAAVPLFFLTWKPVDEWDSLHYLRHLIEWRAGRLTPYEFQDRFVAFGPSRFLPAMMLSRSDWFFAFIGLKPVILMGLALYLVGEELEIPARLRLWTVAAAAALEHLWGNHSGVSTLKSDSLYAAGAVLLAVVVLRTARGRPFDPALFAFALVFCGEKYSGMLFAVLMLPALWMLGVRLAQFVPAALLFLATTGHYYLRGILRWGNPFYPFQVRFAGFTLPGTTADFSATTIAAHLGDPALWKLFFLPAHAMSPAGLLFPAVLAAMLGVSLWTVISGLRRRPPEFWLALMVMIGWSLYARQFFSAGSPDRSLAYLQTELVSLRYVEGFLALGEMFLILLLWRRGIPEAILLAIVALQGASRLWLLYTQPSLRLFPAAVCLAGAAIAGLLCVRLGAPAAAALVLLTLPAAHWVVERNRQAWLPDWKEMIDPFRRLPATDIFLLQDMASGSDGIEFALSGARLQHDVQTGPDLRAAVRARYAVRIIDSSQQRSELRTFEAGLAPVGYHTVIETPRGIIMERVTLVRWDTETAAPAWYLEAGTLPRVGVETDAGGVTRSTHELRAGELALSLPGALFRLSPELTQLPRVPEGAAVRAQNCGPLQAGRPQGLIYRFRAGRWRADRPPLAPSASPAISMERGHYQLEWLHDQEGPYLRVQAGNPAKWLVLVTGVPSMPDGAPYTAVSAARCPVDATCTFWLWMRHEVSEHAGPADGQWRSFQLLRRVRSYDAGDHIAIGIRNVRMGDYFDVRELGVLQGFFP